MYFVDQDGTYESFTLYRKDAIVRASHSLGHRVVFIKKPSLAVSIKKEKPDWIISEIDLFRTTRVSPRLLDGIKLCILAGDEELDTTGNHYLAAAYPELCVFYLKEYAQKYAQLNNTHWFPESADYSKNIPLDFNKKSKDIIYIGSPFDKRVKRIEAISAANKTITIYGNPRWLTFNPMNRFYAGVIQNDNYYEEISSYKINLAMMEGEKTDVPHLNAKLFDSAVAGTIPLTTHYAPFITDYGLEEGKDFFTYRSNDDLLKKIELIKNLSSAAYVDVVASLREKLLRFDYTTLYKALFATMDRYDQPRKLCNTPTMQPISPLLNLFIRVDTKRLGSLVKFAEVNKNNRVPLPIFFKKIYIPSNFSFLYLNVEKSTVSFGLPRFSVKYRVPPFPYLYRE